MNIPQDNQDNKGTPQNPDGNAAGAPQPLTPEQELEKIRQENETLKKNQDEAQKKITDLSTENAIYLKRFSDLGAPGQQNQPPPGQPQAGSDIVRKRLSRVSELIAEGRHEEAAELQNQILQDNSNEVANKIFSMNEMFYKLKSMEESILKEKPHLKPFREVIAQKTGVYFQTLGDIDKAVAKAVEEIDVAVRSAAGNAGDRPPAKGSQPPAGSQGDTGQRPPASQPPPSYKTPEQGLAERKSERASRII